MAKRNVPQPFEIDKLRFRDCFTAPSMRHFAVFITGWVLTVGVHTISQVILSGGLHESEHFVSLYRFLARAKWSPDQVAFQVFEMIMDTLLPDATEFELILDDTLNNHVGRKIFGAGVQHDGDAPKTGKPIGYGSHSALIWGVFRSICPEWRFESRRRVHTVQWISLNGALTDRFRADSCRYTPAAEVTRPLRNRIENKYPSRLNRRPPGVGWSGRRTGHTLSPDR
jgi:hypothetical protein